MSAARRAAAERAQTNAASAEEIVKANTSTGISLNVSHRVAMDMSGISLVNIFIPEVQWKFSKYLINSAGGLLASFYCHS